MRSRVFLAAGAALAAVVGVLVLAACGGGTRLLRETTTVTVAGAGSSHLGFPTVATKNTTRVPGDSPVADAAGVALAVYPSAAAGTHPKAVTIAPTDDWEAALAASVLMAPPIRAPVLLSGAGQLPSATSKALSTLAPSGSGDAGGAQVIRVGHVAKLPASRRAAAVHGSSPAALAAAIDRFQTAAAGKPSSDVVIASTSHPAYAMPAAGWAAESGDPVLFVTPSTIPAATREALQAHQRPHIYVLGPRAAVAQTVVHQLAHFGAVTRIAASNPAASSVTFAAYRHPACPGGQPCAHVPESFGWALRSPGHGYTLLNASRPLDAAASAALSGSGDYGPQLLVDNPSRLPRPVLNFFLDYATPGYDPKAGPTAPVYNHGWVIGDDRTVSTSVQAELDNLLQAIPESSR